MVRALAGLYFWFCHCKKVFEDASNLAFLNLLSCHHCVGVVLFSCVTLFCTLLFDCNVTIILHVIIDFALYKDNFLNFVVYRGLCYYLSPK